MGDPAGESADGLDLLRLEEPLGLAAELIGALRDFLLEATGVGAKRPLLDLAAIDVGEQRHHDHVEDEAAGQRD